MDHTCYFCGEVATSREHVPPKNLFPQEDRLNLITVPSCDKHNNSKSGEDEYLRFIIFGVSWQKLPIELQDKVLRSVQRKPLLGVKMLEGIKFHESGQIYYDSEPDRIDFSFESIARALIYHETRANTKGLKLRFIVSDFIDLVDHTPNYHTSREQYDSVLKLCLLFGNELKDKGLQPHIFSYKYDDKFVQFKFYDSLVTSVLFE